MKTIDQSEVRISDRECVDPMTRHAECTDCHCSPQTQTQKCSKLSLSGFVESNFPVCGHEVVHEEISYVQISFMLTININFVWFQYPHRQTAFHGFYWKYCCVECGDSHIIDILWYRACPSERDRAEHGMTLSIKCHDITPHLSLNYRIGDIFWMFHWS